MAYLVRKKAGKQCMFCKDPDRHIDYKELTLLEQFLSHRGKILPRRVTGLCAKHQRKVTRSIKTARNIALLPYTTDIVK